MPRHKRIWYPGATYHIMNRGYDHKPVFLDDDDYAENLNLLNYTMWKFPFKLHAYCLMPNHYHYLIETMDIEIWTIMKFYSQMYTKYFNEKYDRDGALFRGRYHSCEIRSDQYFLQTSRYIHLNPCKANIITNPEAYKWSSMGIYSGATHFNNLVDEERTLKYFCDPPRLQYSNFVNHNDSAFDYEAIIQKDMRENELWLPK